MNKSSKTQTKYPQDNTYEEFFSVSPAMLQNGDSVVTVEWQMNTDSIFLNGVFYKDSVGKYSFVINTTSKFVLRVVKNGKTETYENVTIFKPPPPKNDIVVRKTSKTKDHVYSTGSYDGRFTLGTVSGYRLMYGFPNPQSTSHFVFTVDDYYASNGPNLNKSNPNIIYFQGELQTDKNKYDGGNKTEVLFMFDSVYVSQIIEPVDKNLKPVAPGELANFMHITYIVTNKSGKSKKIGLLALMDMMIGDNDRAFTYINNQKVMNEKKFGVGAIPSTFKNLRTDGEFNELHATTLFTDDDLKTLDTLAIGNWSHFYKTVWDISPTGKQIGDIAYLLKWNKQQLSENEDITFSYYIGIETEPITLLYNQTDIKTVSDEFYFDNLGQSVFNDITKDSLIDFINTIDPSKIQFITINGYADAKGNEYSNQNLSLKRANSVKQLLLDNGIDENIIIVKGHGESFAEQDITCQQNGNKADRKVQVSIAYKR